MYKYEFAKKYQNRFKFYHGTSQVDCKSYEEIVSQGFPSDYDYHHVLSKCVNFVFYSQKRLKVIYVSGYPVDVNFFTETKISV